MDVPKLNTTVGLETGGYTPQIQPINRAAFGEAADAENAKTGQIIGNLGAELQAHINAKQKFDEEQASNDAANAALNKTHDTHDQILEKTGGQAIGAYAGTIKTDNPAIQLTDTAKYGVPDVTLPGYHKEELDPNSFIAQSAKNKQEMLTTLKTPQQRDHASRLYDAGAEVLGRSVSQHEARETQVYQEQAMASNITTWAGIYAANPTAPGAQDFLNNAQSSVKDFSKLKKEDDASAGLRLQQVDDTFAKKTIELHPEAAGQLLALNLSTEGRAFVQGAQVNNLQNDITKAIASGSANVLNPDATPSLEKTLSFVDAQAKAQKFTPEQTTQAESQARSLISTKTAEINQNREQNQKKFSDSALQMFNSGKPHDVIVDALIKKNNFDFTGYSATDKTNQKEFIDKLFTDTESARRAALKYLTPEQQAALELGKKHIEGKVGVKATTKLTPDGEDVNLFKTLSDNLDRKVSGSGMTPAQIVDYADESTKTITIKTHWFKKDEAVTSGIEQVQKDIAGPLLEGNLQRYDPVTYRMAKQALGDNATPAAIVELATRFYKSKAPVKDTKAPAGQGYVPPAYKEKKDKPWEQGAF